MDSAGSSNIYCAYTYVTNIIKEKEAINLRVEQHGGALRKGNWDGVGAGKGGRLYVILFQLKTRSI